MSQKRMGPAPFASFEDLSDEIRHNGVERLPEIHEQPPSGRLQAPNTPRIDISRASSSSHHEEDNSRDSTPERELFGARLGVAFTEDGAMDLRSSTEELDFQEVGTTTEKCRTSSGTTESHVRKDSQGSEPAFLSVSGRTSRLSSVGSQGSHASNQSHLSSRSPSPHKMLLETSFCGAPEPGAQTSIEQTLLARKADPTQAVLAEGISIEMRRKIRGGSPRRRQPPPPIVVQADGVDSEVVQHPMSPGKTIVSDSGVEYTFIPLKGPLPTNMQAKPVGLKNKTPSKVNKTSKSAPVSKQTDSPVYIRIKLKPDHMYNEDGSEEVVSEPLKPDTLNLNNGKPATTSNRPRDSRTPSPCVSRKSSFASLFRSKESSPESPGDHRVRSKSKEREHKSVFGIFKPKKSCIKKQTSPERPTPQLPLEFTFNSNKPAGGERLKYYETPLEGDSIRIPLHSPGTEPEPLKLLSPSPPNSPKPEAPPAQPSDPRHSSTSSENVVFTTHLGSNNDIFTTKLPKEKGRITENHCEKPVERKLSEPENIASISSPPKMVENKIEQLKEQTTPRVTRSESSESEREISEATGRKNTTERDGETEDEHELRTLVLEALEDSGDEELPYVPTTLPLERSVAVPIVPIKQRGEIRMCGIERPRSTTPINPSCLEEYCEDGITTAEPKLRISLPREEADRIRGKSPRKWTDFAEKDMKEGSSPPPLPPRGAPKDWINFEEVPEKRKPPKRIQVIPQRAGAEENVIYSYVNPEDCKCECHELAPRNPQPTDAFPTQKLSS